MKRCARNAATSDRDAERDPRHHEHEAAEIAASVVERAVYGFDSVDDHAPGRVAWR